VYCDGLSRLYLHLYLYLFVFVCCVFVLLPTFWWIKIYIIRCWQRSYYKFHDQPQTTAASCDSEKNMPRQNAVHDQQSVSRWWRQSISHWVLLYSSLISWQYRQIKLSTNVVRCHTTRTVVWWRDHTTKHTTHTLSHGVTQHYMWKCSVVSVTCRCAWSPDVGWHLWATILSIYSGYFVVFLLILSRLPESSSWQCLQAWLLAVSARGQPTSVSTGLCSCRVRGVDGSCAKHLTVESYMVIYAPNSYTY